MRNGSQRKETNRGCRDVVLALIIICVKESHLYMESFFFLKREQKKKSGFFCINRLWFFTVFLGHVEESVFERICLNCFDLGEKSRPSYRSPTRGICGTVDRISFFGRYLFGLIYNPVPAFFIFNLVLLLQDNIIYSL